MVAGEGAPTRLNKYVPFPEISPPPHSAHRGVRGGAVPLITTPQTSYTFSITYTAPHRPHARHEF